jgi:hypothetical protein
MKRHPGFLQFFKAQRTPAHFALGDKAVLGLFWSRARPSSFSGKSSLSFKMSFCLFSSETQGAEEQNESNFSGGERTLRDFNLVEFRVGRIVHCEPVKKSSKLYQLM